MDTLDELKQNWKKGAQQKPATYTTESLAEIFKSRVTRQMSKVMRYFWPAFVYQVLVYAMLCHVAIRYGGDWRILLACVAGVVLFIPFTWVMMSRFKEMAVSKVGRQGISTIQDYVTHQRDLMQRFLSFKKKYEFVLIPIASFIGVWLTFEIFVPGGVMEYFSAALVIYGVTLVSCLAAIISENRRNFDAPIDELQKILDEFNGSIELNVFR